MGAGIFSVVFMRVQTWGLTGGLLELTKRPPHLHSLLGKVSSPGYGEERTLGFALASLSSQNHMVSYINPGDSTQGHLCTSGKGPVASARRSHTQDTMGWLTRNQR